MKIPNNVRKSIQLEIHGRMLYIHTYNSTLPYMSIIPLLSTCGTGIKVKR